jgi:MYXO-CTERM domain-containing protein
MDCCAYGSACVDHRCNGGTSPGTGCTWRETHDCGGFGANCVDHQCNGGTAPGTGCTWRQTHDCTAMGGTCSRGTCTVNGASMTLDAGQPYMLDAGEPYLPPMDSGVAFVPPPDAGEEAAISIPPDDSGHPGEGPGPVTSSGGCTAAPAGPLLLALLALRRRRR